VKIRKQELEVKRAKKMLKKGKKSWKVNERR
jgi:hypothetical protein